MGHRHKAREFAIQVLYQIEMQAAEPKAVFDLFWRSEEVQEDIQSFTTSLVDGVYRNRSEIDQLVEKNSHHWRLPRMAVVDRNILRLGVYELLYLHDIPTSVILNEAVELAKKFGTEDSGAFINGILDRVAKETRK
ncbi:MAG: transcription antitermination factor NusB [Deltaproteobacteria bacterium]|nr:transcription antitermination factor NusB [Deltaproteobacteria bacterium]